MASSRTLKSQRQRDENNNKICVFERGGHWGAERKIVQNAVFLGKRHDNKNLKVQILLSRNLSLRRLLKSIDRKKKGGCVKGRFWRMCPRSGFWCKGKTRAGKWAQLSKINFLGPEIARWGHAKGWGSKSSFPPRESLFFLGGRAAGMSAEFAGMSWAPGSAVI